MLVLKSLPLHIPRPFSLVVVGVSLKLKLKKVNWDDLFLWLVSADSLMPHFHYQVLKLLKLEPVWALKKQKHVSHSWKPKPFVSHLLIMNHLLCDSGESRRYQTGLNELRTHWGRQGTLKVTPHQAKYILWERESDPSLDNARHKGIEVAHHILQYTRCSKFKPE